MEVAVTGMVAGFLTIFYGLNLFNTFPTPLHELTAITRFIGALLIVVLVLLKGDRFPRWIALVGALNELSAFVYFVGFTTTHEQIVFRLQEFPLIALYLSWLFPASVARLTIYPVMVFTMAYSVWFGPAAGTDHQSGLLNVVSLVFFTVVAMSVGSFVKRNFKKQTEIDPLTGAMNRRGLGIHGDAILVQCQKQHRPVSVVLVDLDGFKRINDQQGHNAGDRVLCQIVDHLNTSTRRSDIVARLGGDEFVVVMPETDEEAAQRVMERIHLSAVHEWSFGVAQATAEDNLSMVILRADRAMYTFKRARAERARERSDSTDRG